MQFAVEVTDESVNKTIHYKEFAICEQCSTTSSIVPGRLYYVERIRDGLAEKTIRLAQKDASGLIKFVSHSTTDKYSGSASYPAGKGETITVLGVVVGKYSPI